MPWQGYPCPTTFSVFLRRGLCKSYGLADCDGYCEMLVAFRRTWGSRTVGSETYHVRSRSQITDPINMRRTTNACRDSLGLLAGINADWRLTRTKGPHECFWKKGPLGQETIAGDCIQKVGLSDLSVKGTMSAGVSHEKWILPQETSGKYLTRQSKGCRLSDAFFTCNLMFPHPSTCFDLNLYLTLC